MAKARKKAAKKCAGLKSNGRLKKGYKFKKGASCPVKSAGKKRKRAKR